MSRFVEKLPLALLGLTGGIGSGKSTAADFFEDFGIPVVDADKLGHKVIAPGGRAESAVVEAFGEDILTEGRIDRKKLGQAVFSSTENREMLNDLVHPAIYQEMEEQCHQKAAQGYRVMLMEAALLGDNGSIDPAFSGLILVVADDSLRKARLCASRGLTPAEVERRMAAQVPPESKRSLATFVLHNDSTPEALQQQVESVAHTLHQQYG